jgi:hypothetical protein
MKLKYLYIALEDEDFQDDNLHLTSDFDFQVYSFFNYFNREIVKLKFESKKFEFITIRGRKKIPNNIILQEDFKSLEIEILFDLNRYKELYPFENEYPLTGFLKPIIEENKFNDFVVEMIINGLTKVKKENELAPWDFLINMATDFKTLDYKNEWIHKTRTFKEHSIKTILMCKVTCNYFCLELIIEKNKREIFREEILKTAPSPFMFKHKFKDTLIEGNFLKVLSNDLDNPLLFEIDLITLN